MFSNVWSNAISEGKIDDYEDPPTKDEILYVKENDQTIFIRIDKKYLPNADININSNISITPFALRSCTFLFINAILFFVLGNIIIIMTIASRKLL